MKNKNYKFDRRNFIRNFSKRVYNKSNFIRDLITWTTQSNKKQMYNHKKLAAEVICFKLIDEKYLNILTLL